MIYCKNYDYSLIDILDNDKEYVYKYETLEILQNIAEFVYNNKDRNIKHSNILISYSLIPDLNTTLIKNKMKLLLIWKNIILT